MRDEIIKRNLFVTITSLLVFFLLSLIVVSYSSRQTLETELINVSNVVNNQIMGTVTEDETYEVVDSFTKDQTWLRIVVANSSGYIVMDSSDDTVGESITRSLSDNEIQLAKEETIQKKRIYVENNVMHLITMLNEDIIVRTSVTIQTNNVFILNSIFYVLILIMLVLIVNVFYSRKTSKLVTDAFDNISSHLKTINEGEYQQIITAHKFSEVENSLKEINEINRNIYTSILQIKNEGNKINFIINNMQQGIIILDEFNQTLLINEYAVDSSRITCKNPVGKDFHEVLKNEFVIAKIEKALAKKQSYYFDVKDENSQKIYAYSLTYFKNKWNDVNKKVGLLAISILDVTEERLNDQIKADFIANASHELKTPITSISGFSELLRSNSDKFDEKTNKYLRIINEESTRLKAIIEDLLYLSNLEHSKENIQLEEKTYFVSLVQEIYSDYKFLAEAEKVTLRSEVEDLFVVDNAMLVKHLIANLVENAIKYNRPNGEVLIKVYRKERNIILSVSDTGIGIEEKNLDKIFERFYRVDTSHNRSKNGTGLGLNIVRQICSIMNANIDVTSTIDVGTTFTITFNMGV